MCTRFRRRAWAGVGALCFLALPTPADSAVAAAPKPVVAWKVTRAPTKPVSRGARFSVVITGAIDPGWHIYALDEPEGGPIATDISLVEGDPASLLHVDQARPQSWMDPAFRQRTMLFRDKAEFTLALQTASPVSSGLLSLHVLVRYQACSERLCLPPHTDRVDAAIPVQR